MGACNIELGDLWIIENAFFEYGEVLDKERERIKKHLDAGHTGSSLDPRDYRKEWEISLQQKKRAIEILEKIKECAKS